VGYIGSVGHVYEYIPFHTSLAVTSERHWGALYVFDDALVIVWQPAIGIVRPGKPRDLRHLDTLPETAVTRDDITSKVPVLMAISEGAVTRADGWERPAVARMRWSMVIETSAIIRATLTRRPLLRRMEGTQLELHSTDGGAGAFYVRRKVTRRVAELFQQALGERFVDETIR
jgi:hypothetical protein